MTGRSDFQVAGFGFIAGFASGRQTAPSATCSATTCSCFCEPSFGPLFFCIVVIALQGIALEYQSADSGCRRLSLDEALERAREESSGLDLFLPSAIRNGVQEGENCLGAVPRA